MRTIFFLSLFAFILSSGFVKAEVKTFQCGDDCTATLDENGVMRVSGTGKMWGYNSETRYHTPWINDASKIKSLIVDDGITNVGKYAFYICYGLKTIELAQSVQTVDVGAFDEIAHVQSVTMYDTTVWDNQDNFNDFEISTASTIKVNCYGDMAKCQTNFLNTPRLKGANFAYKGKKIYTVEEASKASKETGNKYMIRYK